MYSQQPVWSLQREGFGEALGLIGREWKRGLCSVGQKDEFLPLSRYLEGGNYSFEAQLEH